MDLETAQALQELTTRIVHLERLTYYPNSFSKDMLAKEQAAAQQATQHLYAPLRSDTGPLLELTQLARDLVANKSTLYHDAFRDRARVILEKYSK